MMPFASTAPGRTLRLRGGVPGTTSAGVARLPGTDRRVVLVNVDQGQRRGTLGALTARRSPTPPAGPSTQRLPLVVVLASSGADVVEGVASLARLGPGGPGALGVLRGRAGHHRGLGLAVRARPCCSAWPTWW